MLGREPHTATTVKEGEASELSPDPWEQVPVSNLGIILNTFFPLSPHIVPVPILWILKPKEPELQNFSLLYANFSNPVLLKDPSFAMGC